MSIEGVGFDLDHTLAVPATDRRSLLAEAVDAVDAPPIGREEYVRAHRRNLAGRTREVIFADLLEDGPEGASARELARAYRRRVNDALVPVDGAEDLLAGLRDRYRVGLLTNGPVRAQRSKLDVLGWTDAFDAVVVSGEVGAGKPDRRAFEALLDRLGTVAGRTAYVGDETEADVVGAAEAGLRVVQVLTPEGPGRHPRADRAVDRASLAADLPGVLEGL